MCARWVGSHVARLGTSGENATVRRAGRAQRVTNPNQTRPGSRHLACQLPGPPSDPVLTPSSHVRRRSFQLMRVLVVDDEVRMAALVRRGLEEEGYAVDVVGDG